MDGFDVAEYFQLPDGCWVPRRGEPCPDCCDHDPAQWLIVRFSKFIKDEDGNPVRKVVVACQCQGYFEHRREHVPGDIDILGRNNVRTGEVIWAEGGERW